MLRVALENLFDEGAHGAFVEAFEFGVVSMVGPFPLGVFGDAGQRPYGIFGTHVTGYGVNFSCAFSATRVRGEFFLRTCETKEAGHRGFTRNRGLFCQDLGDFAFVTARRRGKGHDHRLHGRILVHLGQVLFKLVRGHFRVQRNRGSVDAQAFRASSLHNQRGKCCRVTNHAHTSAVGQRLGCKNLRDVKHLVDRISTDYTGLREYLIKRRTRQAGHTHLVARGQFASREVALDDDDGFLPGDATGNSRELPWVTDRLQVQSNNLGGFVFFPKLQ